MSNAAVYQEELSSLAPSTSWRERTLTAMYAAETQAPARSFRPRFAVAAAAVALVCVGGFFAWRQFSPVAPQGTLQVGPGYVSASNLPKLTIAPNGAGMAMGPYGDDMGLLVVKDYEEQTSKNPTLDNTVGITELPVYKNDPPMERERLNPELNCPGATLGEKLAAFYKKMAPQGGLRNPTLETTVDYDCYGRASTWFAWFEDDPTKSLTDRLLDYCFNRLGDEFHVDEFGDTFSYCQLPAWPANEGVLYPIRTAEQAEADFRAGDFLGADVETNPADAKILHVELTYFTQTYQAYIQPVYKITYTQDYWDESRVMRETEDPDAYTSVSFAYVPAVAEEYVEMVEAQFRFN